jgi:hypothetical protein
LEGITDDAEGLICKDCVARHPFLRAYSCKSEFTFVNFAIPKISQVAEGRKSDDQHVDGDIILIDENFSAQKADEKAGVLPVDKEPVQKKQKLSADETQVEINVEAVDIIICPLSISPPLVAPPFANLYVKTGWRDQLCRCPDCTSFYDKEEIEYLLDEDVEEEELDDDCKSIVSLEDAGMNEFNNLPREQAIQVCTCDLI